MNKKPQLETDQLFKDHLIQHEASFEPAAWEHMRALLDESDRLAPIPLVPPQSNKKNKTLILIIMTSLSLLSISTLFFFGSANSKPATENSIVAHDNKPSTFSQTESLIETSKSLYNAAESSNIQTSISNDLLRQADSLKQKTLEKINGLKQNLDSAETIQKDGKTYRVFYRKTLVPETYETYNLPLTNLIQDAWFGLHFTAQRPRNLDSLSAGFNLQFMSGNRIKAKNIGLYMGVDWGMQFYGSGKKNNVVLNNVTQDSGYTKLSSHSMDFLGRLHLEYAKFPIIPYVNVMAGPRLYSTGQLVASYMTLKQAESRTVNNAHTSVSMLYGFGVGARIRLSSVVSLDARYEWINGSPVRIADLNQSTFNGLSYNLKTNKITPHLEQFKIGLIFNLSERAVEKRITHEAYYKTYAVDSVEINSKDSNLMILPCPCTPCEKQTIYIQDNGNIQNPGNNTHHSPTPINTGGGRSSFPGIRPTVKPAGGTR